ncbi:heavy metal translocating P-type ATPase [Mesobacillus zeae]
MEKAGAFDNLKLRPEKAPLEPEVQESFWRANLAVLISLAWIILGYTLQYAYGENDVLTVLAFVGAILSGGFKLFRIGLSNLARLDFDMKTLMTIAVIGAALIGEWTEGAVVVVLFAISERLESYSMDKARASIRSLMDLAPREALVRRNGIDMMLEVDEIEIGDLMVIKPGQKIAMDGTVIKGRSAVSQAAITGESLPVEKTADDEVFAGTLNGEGHLEVRVTKRTEDTTIAKIIHLVEEAQEEKAPSQAFVDRFAKYYTPAIILFAALTAILPPLVLDADWGKWVYQGLAVLVVGCPCALVISTPVSIVTAIGNAARNGILIKGGIHLEEMGSIKAIAFDKTGTLTKGALEVTDFELLDEKYSEIEILGRAAALEYHSQHPLALAINTKAEADHVNFKEWVVDSFESVTGKGIIGSIKGENFYVGRPDWFEEMANGPLPQTAKNRIAELQSEGKTVMAAGLHGRVLALIAAADTLREESQHVVHRLHQLGIQKTIMLTGDNEGTARAIGKVIGVSDIQAGLMPEDKLTYIKELQKTYGKTAMVGDGINDAPALAAASVGIAMGGAGTDTALETADIALMADDLKQLPFTVKLSRKALSIIKQNITFSLGVKLLALLLVIPGWLTLWIAIFADMGATLIVTLNAIRLMWLKK